jgi:hypothetical protein
MLNKFCSLINSGSTDELVGKAWRLVDSPLQIFCFSAVKFTEYPVQF